MKHPLENNIKAAPPHEIRNPKAREREVVESSIYQQENSIQGVHATHQHIQIKMCNIRSKWDHDIPKHKICKDHCTCTSLVYCLHEICPRSSSFSSLLPSRVTLQLDGTPDFLVLVSLTGCSPNLFHIPFQKLSNCPILRRSLN
uniref:Uncharacterized protein n=1 Tax=Rhizophora mucronata TaxID=61149 RepID=A0A2P2P148_RHIMU